MQRCALICVVLVCAAAFAGDAPDGTAFTHPVLSVDGSDLVRIRYCGLPLQVRLANVQFKGADFEGFSLKYLKDTVKAGASVKIELEPDLPGDGTAPPRVQLFAGTTHVNLELVKRGLALSDGRSQKYGEALQAAQTAAMQKKAGMWAAPEVATPVKPPPSQPVQPATPPPTVTFTKPLLPETAPADYRGAVVADLNSKEYHYPGSRYAQNIRAGARIEYKSLEEAERAGKSPSPFSFPDRAKALAEKASAGSGATPQKIVEEARKALAEAIVFMQEARKVARTNLAAANENWKKAGKLLTAHLDRLTPVADASPNDQTIQKLAEDMSMNLYSCNKYQSL